MGRPTKPIVISAEDRAQLEQWARRPKTAQRLALRARIVLGCADGLENRQVARQLRVTDQTVCKWRERFRSAGLDGLSDEPRPGTPRKITDERIEDLLTRTLESKPASATPLVHAQYGQDGRAEPVGGFTHLAGIFLAAASRGDFQAL